MRKSPFNPILFVAAWTLNLGLLSAQCPVGFDTDFYHGTINQEISTVLAATSYEAAEGTQIVLGTPRGFAGGVLIYDGQKFTTIGAPTNGSQVTALLTRGSGSTLEIYAAGNFISMSGVSAAGIARFDGKRWHPLGSGVQGPVSVLAFYNDGSGEKLYVGGQLTSAGGMSVQNIAAWDGTQWSDLAGGVNDSVEALKVHDDGSGPALWVGGRFTMAGGNSSSYLARWNGTAWTTFPAALTHTVPLSFDGVYVFESVHSGAETGLFVGGIFDMAGGINTGPLARWDGTTWHGVGPISPFGAITDLVDSLLYVDEPSGGVLYVGGSFVTIGGLNSKLIGRYNLDGTFSPLGIGLDGGNFPDVAHLIRSTTPSLPGLWAIGSLDFAGGSLVRSMARWDGMSWHSIDAGVGLDRVVTASARFLTPQGERLLVATEPVSGNAQILSFDGAAWTVLAANIDGRVEAMRSYNNGSGEKLYVGGEFQNVDGVAASHLACFDGTNWDDLDGVTPSGPGSPIRVLHVSTVGGSEVLVIGGAFSAIGGVLAANIACFDGVNFSPLGSGVVGTVRTLTTHTASGVTHLWIGGQFTLTVDGFPVSNLVRWNGSTFVSAQAANINGVVLAVQSYRNHVYAAGTFTTIGGVNSPRISRFDGTNWLVMPGGPTQLGSEAAVFAVYDDGAGADLFLASTGPLNVSPTALSVIGSWNGTSWTIVGPLPFNGFNWLNGAVFCASEASLGQGSSLYFGGTFTRPGARIMRYGPTNTDAPACGMLSQDAEGSVGLNANGPFAVLRVNSSAGNGDHRVNVNIGQNITINVQRPPTVVGPAPFVLFGYLGVPDASDALVVDGLGTFVFQPCHPLLPFDPASFVLFDNLGTGACGAIAGSTPAPFTFSLLGGVSFSLQVTLQGMILDPSAPFGLSVTNAILLAVGP